jgi:hypothetical protein
MDPGDDNADVAAGQRGAAAADDNASVAACPGERTLTGVPGA